MKRTLLIMCAVLLALAAQAQEWQLKQAPVMTPWGEQIDPENVWQEYPRPQLVRSDWMNLNGVWGYFRRENMKRLTAEGVVSRFNKRILVPFGVESALSGIKETDLSAVAKSTLMYRRTFTLPDSYKNKRVLLHFGAVDWQCAVFVNRQEVGTHFGGSDPFSFDITSYLKSEGEQELQVAVYDPSSKGGQPIGKQTTNPGSIWYTSCSGIWQTVWLEPVNDCYIQRYEVVPDAANGTARVKVIASDPSCKFYLVARDGEEVVATTEKTRVGEEVTLTISDPKLWSPDSPFLYNLDIYLCRENCEECDRARGYFGLRTLSKAMIDGHPGFLLNGKPLFMFGPLDQGWWPDGLLTPPSYEAMIYDLQTIKALGMNMVRKHIKVENDLWYEWCDRNGLIVWQDMPCGSDNGSLGTKDELQHIFYTESEHIVTALKQHPSICVWIPYNESWGQDVDAGSGHTMRGYLVVRNADADMGRLMDAASGWHDFEIGDITDAHSYPSPNGTGNPGNNRVNVCGEYGGITYLIEDHLWAGSKQVYTSVDNSEDYTERFNQFTSGLQSLQYSKGLWGAVYTQITDVEEEVNGILTYDRKVLKVNEEQLASIRENIEKTINQRMSGAKSVVKAGDNSADIYWNYTTTQPADGWEQPAFDDSAWKRGAGGFGDISQSAARVRTKWSTSDIWIRRTFRLADFSADNLKDLCLRIFYDEDTEVYINGVLAFSITGYNTTYQIFGISEASRRAINLEGDNVIAIHTHQSSGGQYIDAGFSIRSYKNISECKSEPMAQVVLPKPTDDGQRAYLLSYSKTDDDRLYYAYSYDGLQWQQLNDGGAVYVGKVPVRRPFIRRLEDAEGASTFHLIFGGNEDAPGLYHLTSTDLAVWQPLEGHDAKVVDAPVISPEMCYEPTTKYYIYYWSRRVRDQYAVQFSRTRDFGTYSRPSSYFEPSTSITDLHTFRASDKYVALYSDPSDLGLCTATCVTVNPGASRFADFTSVFGGKNQIMNPVVVDCFDDNGWLLFCTEDSITRLFVAPTSDAASIKWWEVVSSTPQMPAGANGGKILTITRSELSQLQQALADLDAVREIPATLSPRTPQGTYTLQGIRVAEANRRGVFITDGKKRVMK